MRAKIFGDFTFVNKKVPKLKNKGHFIITTSKVEKVNVALFFRFEHYLYPKIQIRVRNFYYIKILPDLKSSHPIEEDHIITKPSLMRIENNPCSNIMKICVW